MARHIAQHGARDHIDMTLAGLRLQAYRFHGATVISVDEPSLTGRQEVEEFAAKVREAIDKTDDPNVVLDFANVQTVSSTLLGQLLALENTLAKQQRQLRLARPNETLRQLLSATRLDRKLTVHENLDAATTARRKRWWWPFGS